MLQIVANCSNARFTGGASMHQDQRFDGWKAIANFLGRERTTATRWARERGLPIHRVPGGRTGTVYALRSELDAWLSSDAPHLDDSAKRATPYIAKSTCRPDLLPKTASHLEHSHRSRRRAPNRRRLLAVLFVGLILAAIVAIYTAKRLREPGGGASEQTLPRDPTTAALFLHARENWARRKSDSIDDAIREFTEVIGRDPGYGPAYAGLADAYLIGREFGSIDDKVAFPRAKSAAQVALKIDPNLAGAQRALGFVQYWWDHDKAPSEISFRRALTLAPADPQTHFWYGNMLADRGDFTGAIRELETARALNPESVAIQTDWAWTKWSIGERDLAVAELLKLATLHPDLASPHDCLRVIYLAERDYPRYLDEFSKLAQLRKSSRLARQSTSERLAFARGGAPGLGAFMLANAMRARAEPVQDVTWPAFVASSFRNRPALITLLRQAVRNKQIWGSAGQVARITRDWEGDREISELLNRIRITGKP